MTTEQHLRVIVGDLVLQVARLQAEVDAAKEALEKARAAMPPPEAEV